METLKRLVIVGAGGHGRDVAAIVRDINAGPPVDRWELVGFVDDNKTGDRIVGKVSDLPVLDSHAVVAVNDSKIRQGIAKRLGELAIPAATLIHPSAQVGDDCIVGSGCVLAANTVLTTGVSLGVHVHMNVGATVSQGSHIGRYATLSPGVHVAGDCVVGETTSLGCGAVTRNLVSICAGVTVGAGAVVVDDIKSAGTYIGVPAKRR